MVLQLALLGGLVLLGLGNDRVDGDGRFAGGAVADDQLALAAADRDHRVDRHDAGLHRDGDGFALDDAGSDFLHRVLRGGGDVAFAVDGLAERVDHAAEECFTDGHREQLAGGAAFGAFLDGRVITKQHDADFAFFEVEGHAGDATAEVDHFVEQDAGESFHFGHAVTDLADSADIGFFDRRGDAGDLLFEFLKDAAHKEGLLVGVVGFRRRMGSECVGKAREAALH